MLNKKNLTGNTANLRKQAEKIAENQASKICEDNVKLIPEEKQKIIHELQVHQIELELQNEELRRIQLELEAARERYFDLYDLAPVGYVTVNEKGIIIEANLIASAFLGVERGKLLRKPLAGYIFKEDQDIYYIHKKKLFESSFPQNCTLRMVGSNKKLLWVQLNAAASFDSEGNQNCRIIINDISVQIHANEALKKAYDEIRTLRGIIPICMGCKKIRDDHGYWNQLEAYIQKHSDVEFSHGLCPECFSKYCSEIENDDTGSDKVEKGEKTE